MTDWLNSVVVVTSDRRPGEHGTAFVIHVAEGDGATHASVVTCAHVVRSLLGIAAEATAVGATGLRVGAHSGEIVADLTDQGIDLAVVVVADLPGLVPCTRAHGKAGERIELVGFEAGRPGSVAFVLPGTLVGSAITAVRAQNRRAWRVELAEGQILPGYSGAPIFRAGTREVVAVVAMNSRRPDGRDGVAVAIENLASWPGLAPPPPAPPPAPTPRRWVEVTATASLGLVIAAVSSIIAPCNPERTKHRVCAPPQKKLPHGGTYECTTAGATINETWTCPDSILTITPKYDARLIHIQTQQNSFLCSLGEALLQGRCDWSVDGAADSYDIESGSSFQRSLTYAALTAIKSAQTCRHVALPAVPTTPPPGASP